MVKVCIFIVTLTLFGYSCNRSSVENNLVNAKVVLEQVNIDYENISVNVIDSVNFIESKDTINRNIDLSFGQAESKLEKKFDEIDRLQTNQNTKQYLKALLLADFVYAAFSFQLLGEELGMPENNNLTNSWDSLTNTEKFKMGTENLIAVECGRRTNFYMELIQRFLGIEVRDTSILGVHTYPIIKINNLEYIIDPSEPLIFTNDSLNKVLSFNELKKENEKIRFLKTNRTFGSSRLLVSNNLYNNLLPLGNSFKNQFLNYLNHIKPEIVAKIPKCFEPAYNKDLQLSYLNNANNAMAISFNERNLGSKISIVNFKRDYFGKSCEN